MSQQREAESLVIHNQVSQPEVLASDADREAVAGVLSSAFAEGRLTDAEHAERVRAAYGARALGELARLTADLPGPGGEAGGRQAPLVADGVDRCLLCALLICCPPAGIAWLLAARRRSRLAGAPPRVTASLSLEGAGAEDR